MTNPEEPGQEQGDTTPATPAEAAKQATPASPRSGFDYAMWVVLVVLVLIMGATVGWGVRVGAWLLFALLFTVGLVRIVAPEPGPKGLAVRGRAFDVATVWSLAVAVLYLGLTLPM